ncbi:MAG TPA: hypothetical protein VK145_00080 [Candidatus Nanoarchaeia archaeon]|nr:hypothetical protein [Candidatus Nanoarchaeia archaeon]
MEENHSNKTSPTDVVEVKNNQVFEPKEKDNKDQYFSERAKKLTTAVYLVTNLIPQTDPLRVYIRRCSIRLLSFSGKSPIGYSIAEASTEVVSLSKKIVEMLEIAFFSGYVSEMNFSVLKSEFDSFISEISEYERFQSPINPGSLKVDALSRPSPQKTHTVSHKMDIPVAKQSAPKRAPYSKHVTEAKKNSRRESILSIIKRRGTVNIKDVSSVVINCSEKTIQRELLALVDEGVLKKSGDRRWSVYSLAN